MFLFSVFLTNSTLLPSYNAQCFFRAAPSFVWLPGLLAADEPPISEALSSRVSTLLMFGEGAISSSESLALSAIGVSERGVPETVFPFRTLQGGEWSSPRCWSGFRQLELRVARGLRLEATLDSGWRGGLVIRQSAGEVGGARVGVPFPLLGDDAGSILWMGVRARSGVRERSEVRRTGDWSRPVRTDAVLFLLTPTERVPDGALPELDGRVPPSYWLGPATVGGSWTSGRSPTTSYMVPVGEPGAP